MKLSWLMSPFMAKKIAYYSVKRPNKVPALWSLFWKMRKLSLYRSDDFCSHPPIFMTIRITNKCNLRCLGCFQWGDSGTFTKERTHASLNNELSTQAWKEIIDELSLFKPYLSFFGGDPFIRPDFLELVSYASSKGLLSWTSTNGTLFSNFDAEDLVKSGLDYMCVSIDGPEEINDKLRPGKRGYKHILEGLEKIMLAKKKAKSQTPIIQIAMTISELNQYVIKQVANMSRDIGADYFSPRLPSFLTKKMYQESEDFLKQEFNCGASFCKSAIAEYKGIDTAAIQSQLDELSQIWGNRLRPFPWGEGFNVENHFLKPEKVHGDRSCYVPWVRAQIMPDGNVVLCEDFTDITIGNVRKEKFLKLWNAENYIKFRRLVKERKSLPFCPRCCGIYEIPSPWE